MTFFGIKPGNKDESWLIKGCDRYTNIFDINEAHRETSSALVSPDLYNSGFYSLARTSTRFSCVFLALLVLLLSQEYLRTIAERNLLRCSS